LGADNGQNFILGDQLKVVATIMIELPARNKNTQLTTLLKDLEKFHTDIMTAFYQKDPQKANQVSESRDALAARMREYLIGKKSPAHSINAIIASRLQVATTHINDISRMVEFMHD